MKQRMRYITYIIGLVIIMIPIAFEQAHNPLSALMQTILLIVGLLVVMVGKLFMMAEKKKSGEPANSHDIFMLVILIGVAGYILYQYFI